MLPRKVEFSLTLRVAVASFNEVFHDELPLWFQNSKIRTSTC